MTLSLLILMSAMLGLGLAGAGGWFLLRRSGQRWAGWAGWACVAVAVLTQSWWVILVGLHFFKTVVLRQST